MRAGRGRTRSHRRPRATRPATRRSRRSSGARRTARTAPSPEHPSSTGTAPPADRRRRRRPRWRCARLAARSATTRTDVVPSAYQMMTSVSTPSGGAELDDDAAVADGQRARSAGRSSRRSSVPAAVAQHDAVGPGRGDLLADDGSCRRRRRRGAVSRSAVPRRGPSVAALGTVVAGTVVAGRGRRHRRHGGGSVVSLGVVMRSSVSATSTTRRDRGRRGEQGGAAADPPAAVRVTLAVGVAAHEDGGRVELGRRRGVGDGAGDERADAGVEVLLRHRGSSGGGRGPGPAACGRCPPRRRAGRRCGREGGPPST